MKPLGQYPSAEQMIDDWVHDPEFLKLTAAKRQKSIGWMKDQWMTAHAHIAEQQGATPQDLVGKASAMIKQILEMGVGSKLNVPGRLTASALEMFLPDDTTQLVIDLSMMGIGPEAVAGKAAYRILAPIIAGAIGGATKNQAGEGALRGGLEMVGGETTMGAARGVAYMLRKRALPDLDFHRLAGWLEKRFGKKIPDMPALRKLIYEGQLNNEMEDAFAKAQARTNRALGKKFRIQAPVVTSKAGDIMLNPQSSIRFDMSLDEATDRLHKLEQGGWNLRGEPIMTHAGAAARDASHEAEGDIASQIDQANPKAGVDWYTAHGRLKEARSMRNLFTQNGAMDSEGRPNFTLLQGLVDNDAPTSHRYDLIQSMGEDGQKSFRNMLFRNAPEGSVTDRPGQLPLVGLRVSAHGGFYAHPALPYPARHVGDVPYSLGEGRALRALTTIGPYQMLNNLSEMHSMPPMHITKTPAEAAATPMPTDKPGPAAMPATSITPAS